MHVIKPSNVVLQVLGTIIAGTINLGVAWYLLSNIDGICHPGPKSNSPWTCPSDTVFFDASVIWGLVGPKRIFGPLGNYGALNWFFLGGIIGPVAVWLCHKAFPSVSWIPLINFPVLLGATTYMPPAAAVNYNSWIFVGTIFNFFVFRYQKMWWKRYNYTLSAALDAGVAFMDILLYFTMGLEDITAHWWGTDNPEHCDLATCPTAKGVNVTGCPTSQLHPAGLLSPLPILNQVLEDVAMDFITGLPNSHGYTVIMVVINRLSKYAHFAPLHAQFTAPQVATLFTSIGVTLFKVVYGRDPPSVITSSFCDDTPQDVIDQLQQRDALLDELKFNLGRAQVRMKKYADKKRRELSFAIGDYVLKQIGRVAYKLELPATSRIHLVFHVSFLKPCVGEPSDHYILLPLLSTPEGPLVHPILSLDSHKVRVWDEWEIQVLVQWGG
ncbi:oligopeptide transporter 4-like protein [Tanacetum coccineum]